MLSFPPQSQVNYSAGGLGSPTGNFAPHVNVNSLEPTNSSNPAFPTMSARKQACYLCRQRKKKCDAGLPSCSGCIKSGTKCVYVSLATSSTGERQQNHPLERNTAQSHDFAFPGPPAIATWTSTPTQSSTEASVSNLPASMIWNLSSMPDFFLQPDMLSSVPIPDESFALLSTPFQAQSNDAEDTQPTESIRGTSNGFNGSPSLLETPKIASKTLQSAKRTLADCSSDESLFHQFQVRTSPGIQTSSHHFVSPSDSISSTETTAVDSHHSGGISSATSAVSTEQENPHRPPKIAKARKLSPAKPAQGAFSDGLIPSNQRILELLEIFFNGYHHFLPCIHRESFVDRIKRGGSIQFDPLLLVILAVAAPAHSDHRIQALQDNWLARAKHFFDKDLSTNTRPTQLLQAAVWMIFCAYVSGDLTEAWFFLGKACRLGHFLGFDRVDCGRNERLISMAPQTRDAIELEERRKTIWALFLFDRSLSCLAGFSLAIDDRHFHVNFPIDDVQFQACTHSDQLSQLSSDPFTTDLAMLISSTATRHIDSKVSYNHILRASVLLGRIMTFHGHLHISQDRTEYVTEFEKLDKAVNLFCVALSPRHREQQEPGTAEPILTLWLVSIVQTCNILLHHPGPPQSGIGEPHEHIQNTAEYLRCLEAARRTLDILKESARTSPDSLSNPFLVTIHFLCGRFLSIAWHEDRDQSDRDGIDFLLLLVGVVAERWASLGKKFRRGILRDLGKTDEEARQMKLGTGCYLDVECA